MEIFDYKILKVNMLLQKNPTTEIKIIAVDKNVEDVVISLQIKFFCRNNFQFTYLFILCHNLENAKPLHGHQNNNAVQKKNSKFSVKCFIWNP